ncbi:MAG: cob(I)yrinic acid a,c-diamide adenosyltransferase [Muribaculaceae bacterium]|nr:cob(I)yrinic acid a,c-diamide adenosyltransferase [Muribaculaceae bacterium]
MEKSRLYTGGGDDGTTSLVGGERAGKDCVRLDAYGTVDEFSAFLGVLASRPDIEESLREDLMEVQNRLFDIGGYLASRPGGSGLPPVACLDECIRKVEHWIDRLDAETPKIRAFVLPGGCENAAHAHVARTVCRRAERRIIALAREEEVDPAVCRYFNRLSDWLFIMARYLNYRAGVEEIIWSPYDK